jgi:hypothetical protein
MTTLFRIVLAAVATVGCAIAPAHAQWTYIDEHGSFYTLAIGADTDGIATRETRLLTLTINTEANDDQTRYLDAASIKVSSSFLSSTLLSPVDYDYISGGTSSGGCSGTGGGFMCADRDGALMIGDIDTFSFQWRVVIGAGSLFLGDASSPFSLKAVYDAGQSGRDGFYQVSVPLIPEPSTYALMLAGLGAVGFMARRRRPGR